MSPLGTNIRNLRTLLGMTLEQLAHKAEFDPSNLSKIERGIGGYSREGIERIAKSLDVSVGVLFAEGVGEEVVLTGRRKVPILDAHQINGFLSGNLPTSAWEKVEFLLMDIRESARLFAIRVKGDSMNPEFKDSDLVVVDPDMQAQPGDYVVADWVRDGVVIRQNRVRSFDKNGEPVIELAALNPSFPSFRSDMTDFIILGTIVEHRRRWKHL